MTEKSAPMACRNCAWWDAPNPDDWSVIDQIFGSCKRIPYRGEVTEYGGKDEDELVLIDEFADCTALACDASGYDAQVITKAEHFCAMFKEKSDG